MARNGFKLQKQVPLVYPAQCSWLIFLFPGCTSLTSATSSRRILLDFGFLLLDLRITDDETRTMKIGEIRQSDESGSPLLWAEIKQMFEEVTV
jgi:hypothetical protein